MRINVRLYRIALLCCYAVFSMLSFPVLAQNLTPLNCSNGLGYILTNVNQTGVGNVTSFYAINLSDGTATLIREGIIPANLNGKTSRFLNAFGYNVKDNFLYGYRYDTNEIIKLASNGNIQSFTVTALLTNGQFATGDVGPSGIMYLYSTSNRSIVSIDLNTTPYTAVTQLTLPAGHFFTTGLNDWAFSPVDGNIYGMTTGKVLFQYNLSTNTVTNLGNVGGLASQSGSFGTAFMDSQGNLYIGNNTSGNIYRIATPNAPATPIVATLFSSSLAGRNPGDGARCPNQIIPPAANDDEACLSNNTTPVSITVAANDGAGTLPLNSSSVRLVNPSTNNDATTVTVTGQGTFVVNTSTGEVTFTPEGGFTAASVQYTIRDNQGNVSGRATIRTVPALNAPTVTKTDPTCSTPGSLTVTTPQSASLAYSINGTTYQTSPIFANVSQGTYSVTVRYTSGVCVSSPTSTTIQAAVPPTIGSINGTSNPCSAPTSSTYAYTNNTAGGVWSVSPTTVATIDARTGVLTTISGASGTAIITYTVTTGSSCTSTATFSLTVSPTGCTPMPVSLVSFTAQVQSNQSVALDWKTAWEKANKLFLIERSKDLLSFESVGEVRDVAGSSNSINAYRFVDTNPYRGTSYYRLIQLDQDGTRHAYLAVSVIVEGRYGLLPNPVTGDRFTVALDEPATAQIELHNLSGQSIGIRRVSSDATTLTLVASSKLVSGVYIVTVRERGTSRRYRLMIL